MKGEKKKVFVGMSGGVDSSVSAALLKEQGHGVTGVFIKTWHPEFVECSWREDRADAMRVAAQLGIPFLTCDLEDAYKRDVADYMIKEYAAGRTPNPDVMCNRHVKFGAFFDWARGQGADAIATGHYARVNQQPTTDNQLQCTLLAGIDHTKDQSYFLWAVSQDVLAHTLFPVGAMKKTQVREYARSKGLPIADKKDSQGVCFLGKVDMKEFLKRFIDITHGSVLDEQGNIIGTHDGALLYTLGERRGFCITKKTPDDGPRYVIAKDIHANTITVSQTPRSVATAMSERAVITQINWTRGMPPPAGAQLMCRYRYRQPLCPCRVDVEGETATVTFVDAMPFVTPGQSLVLYDGDECLGGGIIDATS